VFIAIWIFNFNFIPFRINELDMDQLQLAKKARKLQVALLWYSLEDTEVSALQAALSNLIRDALAGEITNPLDWRAIPGAYHFNDGNLRKYNDLESAYAEFKIEITGGESPSLRNLRMNANAEH
jgi:hypothetical protein